MLLTKLSPLCKVECIIIFRELDMFNFPSLYNDDNNITFICRYMYIIHECFNIKNLDAANRIFSSINLSE